jgi:hypothetical protein
VTREVLDLRHGVRNDVLRDVVGRLAPTVATVTR